MMLLKSRLIARAIMNDAPLTDFHKLVREAKISQYDQQILDARFVEGKSIVEISLKYGCSTETVNRIIRRAYDKIYNLI